MAKDYFQDIVPPEGEGRASRRGAVRRAVVSPPPITEDDDPDDIDVGLPDRNSDDADEKQRPASSRSIRNITPSRARVKMTSEMREPVSDESVGGGLVVARRWTLWAAAVFGVVVIAVFALFAVRDTTVTVTPQTQFISFDDNSRYTAYPEATAASSTLSYKMITTDLDDSEPVQAQGMQHVETRASGSITVYNAYSPTPVRLIKNTRFAAPDGKIFKTPADIIVPAMKGSSPGTVKVLVIADQAGDQYNIAATQFTLPGLKSNAVSYKGVYAKSAETFTGGFTGDQPAVAPATLTSTIQAVRARLTTSALESTKSNNDYIMFPDLAQITYQSMPSTTEAGGGVRIHERAHLDIIAFPRQAFVQAIGKSVSADAENASITLRPGTKFAAHTSLASSSWGAQPIDFILAGQVQLIWNIDTEGLARALAGRDDSAFQTIITGFPGIKEAHARIQPFWKSTFPSPSKIKITVVEPAASN